MQRAYVIAVDDDNDTIHAKAIDDHLVVTVVDRRTGEEVTISIPQFYMDEIIPKALEVRDYGRVSTRKPPGRQPLKG